MESNLSESEFAVLQGPVVENIARRAGGFLKKLSLRGCQSVGDSAMKTFAQQCHNIEDLNLESCKRITDMCVDVLEKMLCLGSALIDAMLV